MDKLFECAKRFEKLLDKKYHMIVGRKGKTAEIELTFEIYQFHHLVGLHKLKDIDISRDNRENVFRSIISGDISLASVEKSFHFNVIRSRLDSFFNLEQILDDNNLVFRYNKNINSSSHIKAEYLLSTPSMANQVFVFLDKKGSDNRFFCRSIFPKESKDYTIGQPIYTLLYKEKITISTGKKEVQYDRLSPIKKTDCPTP
jgi:hypothetical protein